MNTPYQPQLIEREAQSYWDQKQSFVAKEDSTKEKFYCLSMLPYPSGQIHMGHVRNYTIGDVISRFKRMQGKNVLQPLGWDAFGLPAENAALEKKLAPSTWTYKNIKEMRATLKLLGFAIDWEREIATCRPEYYRWEQSLFLRMYQKGLAYKKIAAVNWDPVDQTVLANEQVVDGRGWRSGALVERKEIKQWFLKITAYAEELLNDLDKLPGWPDEVRTMQRNWIGKSEGLELNFRVVNSDNIIGVFTTRPDTIFGATFLSIAPEHPVALAAAKTNATIATFLAKCQNIKVAEAELATLPKEGYYTGFDAINPINGAIIPIWVANFVLMEYGTGAVMSVPAHDERDFEFATQFGLPIKQVIKAETNWDFHQKAYTAKGMLINSDDFSGLDYAQAFAAIAAFVEKNHTGMRKINYRLRDWGISRQRYWGTPIPIINCEKCGAVPVPEKDLPVVLPEGLTLSDPKSPLLTLPSFLETTCPLCGGKATRETDTFDTFMESSWYYARYTCPDQNNAMFDQRVNYWMPVDQYIGGIEHAVMHLLYARFIYKVMRDEGLVQGNEPFTNLLTQGMVLKDGSKMSKSKGNTVSPVTMIERYGADTARLFIIFASPPTQSLEWSDSGIEGAHRFLKKVWNYAEAKREIFIACNNPAVYSQQSGIPARRQGESGRSVFGSYMTATSDDANNAGNLSAKSIKFDQQNPGQYRNTIHTILQQANHDIERLQLNTVVSAIMKLFNLLQEIPVEHNESLIYEGFKILLLLLNPITPHITHHLWQTLNFAGDISDAPWPKVDQTALKQDTLDLVVQVNGKLRGKISVANNADKSTIEQAALSNANVIRALEGKSAKKIIIVPNKLVNIVL